MYWCDNLPKNGISGLGLLFTLDSHFKDHLQADLQPLDSRVLLSTPSLTLYSCSKLVGRGLGGVLWANAWVAAQISFGGC